MSFTTFSSSFGPTKKSKGRSESNSRQERVSRREREVNIEMDSERDVSTLICIEISRAIMLNPEMNLGVFLRTASNSRRDINISDAVILISAAVLEHIGNKKMSDRLLTKSRTVTSYYDKMNLNLKEIREMFVTLLFALSPEFVKMVEASVKIAIERSATMGKDPISNEQVGNAIMSINESKLISNEEAADSLAFNSKVANTSAVSIRNKAFWGSSILSVTASDSASVVDTTRRRRHRITDKDLLAYASRTKSGKEPNFSEVFPSAEAPVRVKANVHKSGLGYTRESNTSSLLINEMNSLLGCKSVKSYDLNTGTARRRQPKVDDFLDSESISSSAIRSIPDRDSNLTVITKSGAITKSYPTESYLPDTVIIEETRSDSDHTLRPVSSLEFLTKKAADLGLNK
jgi:hypothetical protein